MRLRSWVCWCDDALTERRREEGALSFCPLLEISLCYMIPQVYPEEFNNQPRCISFARVAPATSAHYIRREKLCMVMTPPARLDMISILLY